MAARFQSGDYKGGKKKGILHCAKDDKVIRKPPEVKRRPRCDVQTNDVPFWIIECRVFEVSPF